MAEALELIDILQADVRDLHAKLDIQRGQTLHYVSALEASERYAQGLTTQLADERLLCDDRLAEAKASVPTRLERWRAHGISFGIGLAGGLAASNLPY